MMKGMKLVGKANADSVKVFDAATGEQSEEESAAVAAARKDAARAPRAGRRKRSPGPAHRRSRRGRGARPGTRNDCAAKEKVSMRRGSRTSDSRVRARALADVRRQFRPQRHAPGEGVGLVLPSEQRGVDDLAVEAPGRAERRPARTRRPTTAPPRRRSPCCAATRPTSRRPAARPQMPRSKFSTWSTAATQRRRRRRATKSPVRAWRGWRESRPTRPSSRSRTPEGSDAACPRSGTPGKTAERFPGRFRRATPLATRRLVTPRATWHRSLGANCRAIPRAPTPQSSRTPKCRSVSDGLSDQRTLIPHQVT